jgi:hypothetical protein
MNFSQKVFLFILALFMILILGVYKMSTDSKRRLDIVSDYMCVFMHTEAEFASLYPQIGSILKANLSSSEYFYAWNKIEDKKMQPILRKYKMTKSEFKSEAEKAKEVINKSAKDKLELKMLTLEKGCLNISGR